MAEANVLDFRVDVVGKNVPGARCEFTSVVELRAKHRWNMKQPSDLYVTIEISDFINDIAPASYKPFHLLKRAVLNDLRLGSSAEGKYIIVRLIEPGFNTFFWNCLIEDEQGDVCDLQLYNSPSKELLHAGTVLIIKEPHLRIFHKKNSIKKYPAIRCDSPTDIIVLRRSHHFYFLTNNIVWKNWIHVRRDFTDSFLYFSRAIPFINRPLTISTEDWINRGDQLQRCRLRCSALECYLLALKNCSTESVTYEQLQYRLCCVYYALHYYEKTIAISRFIPNRNGVAFCVARAYYKLRKYKEAKKLLEAYQFVKITPRCSSVRNLMRQCRLRVREQKISGNSIGRLVSDGRRGPSRKLHHADSTGPAEVVPILGKGRGVVLTKDVDADTVLIISKAFASFMRPSRPKGLGSLRCFYSSGKDVQLIAAIAKAVARNPETFGPMIFDLSTGVQPHKEVQLYCDPVFRSEPVCDVRIIEAIYRNNRFFITSKVNGETVAIGAGLFVYPSYLNHSCEPNVYATFYNDVMVVRSIGQVRAGEELVISYVPVEWPFEKRLPFFTDRGFACKCQRCLLHI